MIVFPLLQGCAWRTARADHVVGPTLYRCQQSVGDGALALQTLHVPFLIEAGQQWGVSLGGVQHFALVDISARSNKIPPTVLPARKASGHWFFSPFYVRLPSGTRAVFIRRSVIGAHAGAGVAERSFTIGYSAITATTPDRDALYEIDFNTRRPLEAKMTVTPADELHHGSARLQNGANNK